MLRTANIFLLLLFCLLQVNLWFGESSISYLVSIDRKIEYQRLQNQVDLKRNTRLGSEVMNLQQGDDAIEAYARSRLGLIKSNEIFFMVVDENDQPAR